MRRQTDISMQIGRYTEPYGPWPSGSSSYIIEIAAKIYRLSMIPIRADGSENISGALFSHQLWQTFLQMENRIYEMLSWYYANPGFTCTVRDVLHAPTRYTAEFFPWISTGDIYIDLLYIVRISDLFVQSDLLSGGHVKVSSLHFEVLVRN